jgi:hypothetical protein
MKKTVRLAWVSLLAGAALLTLPSGCSKGIKTQTYTLYRPVYSSMPSVLASINGNPSQPIDSAGKLYVRGQYIFLNELDKGIHVFDNSDPSHPVQTAFLAIPGNQDIAIKGNTLYADMYKDLLAIDISNIHQVKITGKSPNLFSARTWVNGYSTSDSTKIITDWIRKDTTVVIVPAARPRNSPNNGGCCMFFDAAVPGVSNAAAASSSTTGTAGSMAAMVLINNYLYVISEPHSLGIVNVTDAPNPSLVYTMPAGFDLETIYPFRNQLFLGSAEGVFMFDLSNPAQPLRTGTFSHGRACDPVIADGNYAYVTLHAGTSCGGASNELDVLNVQDPSAAQTVRNYPMTSPQGLSKDGNLLFVCDGTSGVKVFDAQDPANLRQLTTSGDSRAYDVIASGQRLLVVADKGLYQYDYSNPSSLKLLSFLPVK